MSSGRAIRPRTTPDEYLAMERASAARHEFVRGEIFSMAGGSRQHNLIVANVVGELRSALRQGPCEVYPSDMRVKIESTGSYTYPDVTIVCGEPRFESEHRDTLLNPLVLFEILSDSTESYDRGGKFEQYRTIAGLAAVVLVSQKETHVESFEPQGDGSWRLRDFRSGDRLVLTAVGCEIAIDDLYLKVFPTGEAG